MSSLGQRWRAARPAVSGIHLDSAACSRQSFAAIDAAVAHARREAEIGGYVAAAEVEEVLADGRAAVGVLTGMSADDVVFTTGATHGLDLLLGSWPVERRLVACVPGEFGPNLAAMAANGFEVLRLPVDHLGRVRVADLDGALAADLPALVHLTLVPSHRGIVQPLVQIAEVCRNQRIPLVVDAAQGLGHVDCVAGAAAVYSTSRKWLAGPRGVGVLAIAPELADTLRPRLSSGGPVLAQLALGEANVAARVAFSVAASELLEQVPAAVRARLAEVGTLTRDVLADVPGWQVVEPRDSPTAITTLVPTDGADVVAVRAELIARHGIVTTAAGPERAPLELSDAVLRLSPHVDVTESELRQFADALSSACAR